MKKLEKMDGKLFESMNSNKVKNLYTIKGGEITTTKGTTKVACGKGWITKDFTDKQNWHLDPKLGVVNDGEPYDFQLAFVVNQNPTDQSTVSLEVSFVDGV
jgi:hypothetical protein